MAISQTLIELQAALDSSMTQLSSLALSANNNLGFDPHLQMAKISDSSRAVNVVGSPSCRGRKFKTQL